MHKGCNWHAPKLLHSAAPAGSLQGVVLANKIGFVDWLAGWRRSGGLRRDDDCTGNRVVSTAYFALPQAKSIFKGKSVSLVVRPSSKYTVHQPALVVEIISKFAGFYSVGRVSLAT